MQLGPWIAPVVLHVSAIRSDALLLCRRSQNAHALLLIRWRRVAKLPVCTRDCASALLTQRGEVLHGSQRRHLQAGVIVPAAIVDRANALAVASLNGANERRHLMLALIPCPHVLRIVAAAAVLIDWQLIARAQPSAILPASRLGLKPGRAVQAATDTRIGVTAHAKRRVECPPEL